MRALLTYLYQVLWRLNGLGLLLLGILDSSFLFLPFGNDLLLIAMAARQHARWPYFAAMAAAGSVLGSFITDAISRKGGEAGLERRFSRRRLEYVKKKITKNAGWTLGLAALMPPPFPFTPFVAAAAVLQYPRKRLLATVALGRLGRFAAEGLLAVLLGKKILQWAESPVMSYTVLGILALSLIGTGVSVYTWFKQGRNGVRLQLWAVECR
ncbi:MAG TPA: VTT domain-containing protein [Terriglobia bacterium]|nr:VTT domain-containing protein [Terriglobia bacterium]